jgi:hypothetical protein
MDTHFIPSRRSGYIFQGVLLTFLAGSGGLAFWASLGQKAGSDLVFYLVLSVLLLAPTPVIIYRLYALTQASYTLERDGLRIRWGLRAEDIPLPRIEWVRPANELGFPLRTPWTAMPGAFSGVIRVEGLGPVEFIASDVSTMLLIATPEKIYAISPANPKAFVRSFMRVIELGSLSPLPTRSIRPAAFIETVWADRVARIILVAGAVLAVILFLTVALRIPALPAVSLGFDAQKHPMEAGPAESLLLLAVLGGFSYVIDLLSGLFFYRREPNRIIAYLLWGMGVAAPLMLWIGALLAR